MRLVICLDDAGGMMFNNRRQSRDSILNSKVLELAKGSRLLMNSYSAKLFGEGENITVSDDFLALAQSGDFCFAECAIESLENVNELYIFRWNRIYPSDVKFGFDIAKENFSLSSTEEFQGSSHEMITLNIYERLDR